MKGARSACSKGLVKWFGASKTARRTPSSRPRRPSLWIILTGGRACKAKISLRVGCGRSARVGSRTWRSSTPIRLCASLSAGRGAGRGRGLRLERRSVVVRVLTRLVSSVRRSRLGHAGGHTNSRIELRIRASAPAPAPETEQVSTTSGRRWAILVGASRTCSREKRRRPVRTASSSPGCVPITAVAQR
jgi:hypothetical protein